MYQIEADKAKNLLIIHLEGFMSDDELNKTANDMRNEVDKLQSGFTLISDIARMKPASQTGAILIQEAQQYLADKGMARTIRVVADPIAGMQFNRISKKVGYSAEIVNSMEEALLLVEEPRI